MVSRLAAFLIWALVAATVVFWVLRLTAQGPSSQSANLAVPQPLTARAELSRLLGSTPVAASPTEARPELSSRFVLTGVMAPKKQAPGANKPAGQGPGLALIAVDGQPAKPYALGAKIDGDLTLLSVTLRTASIGPAGGAPVLTLELPALPPAATGVLPSVSFTSTAPQVVIAPPPALPTEVQAQPPAAPIVMQRVQ